MTPSADRRHWNAVNRTFTRTLLAQVHADVKKYVSGVHLRKDAWVWGDGRDHWEFHGPNKFHWYGSAYDAYEARAKGWMAYLSENGVDEYGRDFDRPHLDT